MKREVHNKPYRPHEDLNARIEALQEVIASLRDCKLKEDNLKGMLNQAIWEITRARGNFTGEFRSKGLLDAALGVEIERDHVYKRKQIILDILAKKEPLESVLKRVVHCVVTKEEHALLNRVLDKEDGWQRYRSAGIEVFRCAGERPEKM